MNVAEGREIIIARFINGLNREITNVVELHDAYGYKGEITT